jgi:hypothetical protein
MLADTCKQLQRKLTLEAKFNGVVIVGTYTKICLNDKGMELILALLSLCSQARPQSLLEYNFHNVLNMLSQAWATASD